MNLFQIDAAIMGCFDAETGELFDGEQFEALQLTREAKIENACLLIKNLTAEAAALQAEKLAFAARQKSAENKAESLRRYLTDYLRGTPFKSTKVAVSFRKSEALEIGENAVIPDEYLKPQAPDIDRKGLKQAIKDGACFDGVELVEKQNMQIK